VAQLPRVVVVTRPTPYEELLARHATRSQADFFLRQRGQSIDAVEALHHQVRGAVASILACIPLDWRRNHVSRAELDRFLFEPEDIIVVVGQDGLVANVSKYLTGQPVIGVNPLPEQFDGILVNHRFEEGRRLLVPVAKGEVTPQPRTMVQGTLDDGQTLCALNELFIGHPSHQSARYEADFHGTHVRHSSSGIIVSTGTGATGWARSIVLERNRAVQLPTPTESRLAFFVREAFPSAVTSIELTEGFIAPSESLGLTSRMEEGVVFGDGIETDFLRFDWGRHLEVSIADQRLMLVA